MKDEPMGETLFFLEVYEVVEEDSNITNESDHSIYRISKPRKKMMRFGTPHVQLTIFSSKWDKSVHVIVLMDKGVALSILNLAI